MKVDRKKALAVFEWKNIPGGYGVSLIDLVCDVLESQSHLWERVDDKPRRCEFAAAHKACRQLDDERSQYLNERNQERYRAEKAEAEVAKLRAELEKSAAWERQMSELHDRLLERCSKACDEAKRKADDHRRQRDELERENERLRPGSPALLEANKLIAELEIGLSMERGRAEWGESEVAKLRVEHARLREACAVPIPSPLHTAVNALRWTQQMHGMEPPEQLFCDMVRDHLAGIQSALKQDAEPRPAARDQRIEELERKSAEDAALIKSLQEQLAEEKAELAGVNELSERLAVAHDEVRKLSAERDDAIAVAERLRNEREWWLCLLDARTR